MGQLAAVSLSVGLEIVVAAPLVAWWARPAPAARSAFLGALVAAASTCVTHPVVWSAALALYPRIGVVPTLFVVESGAVLAEAAAYSLLLRPRAALAVSFCANATSAWVGGWLTW